MAVVLRRRLETGPYGALLTSPVGRPEPVPELGVAGREAGADRRPVAAAGRALAGHTPRRASREPRLQSSPYYATASNGPIFRLTSVSSEVEIMGGQLNPTDTARQPKRPMADDSSRVEHLFAALMLTE